MISYLRKSCKIFPSVSIQVLLLGLLVGLTGMLTKLPHVLAKCSHHSRLWGSLFCSGLLCGPWSVFRPCFLALASLNKIAVYQKVKKSKERSEERGSLKKLKLVLHYWLKTIMDKKSGVNHMELWIEFGCMDIAPYNNFNVFEKLFSEFPISVGQSENNFNFF